MTAGLDLLEESTWNGSKAADDDSLATGDAGHGPPPLLGESTLAAAPLFLDVTAEEVAAGTDFADTPAVGIFLSERPFRMESSSAERPSGRTASCCRMSTADSSARVSRSSRLGRGVAANDLVAAGGIGARRGGGGGGGGGGAENALVGRSAAGVVGVLAVVDVVWRVIDFVMTACSAALADFASSSEGGCKLDRSSVSKMQLLLLLLLWLSTWIGADVWQFLPSAQGVAGGAGSARVASRARHRDGIPVGELLHFSAV